MIKDATRNLGLKLGAVLGTLVLLTAAQDAPAGAGVQSPGATSVEQAIARYDAAWNARDAATLGGLLSPDYVYFTSRGAIWPRERWL